MKRTVEIVVAMLAALIWCACVGRSPGRPSPEADEEDAMAKVETLIIDLERIALAQFGRGEIDGPLALCDDQITYFDPYLERRIEGRNALAAHYESARGESQYALFDLLDPRVQVQGDTGILTYVLETKAATDTPSQETRWKVTAIYHLFDEGWRVVHSHFALFAGTTPRDFEFAPPPADLGGLRDRLLGDLLGLEDAAMERWRRGDPWGFWELSSPGVTYFDPETPGRVDGRDGLRELYAAVEGKILYDISEYIDPRVQAVGGGAVLSYQYRSATLHDDGSVSSDTRWNTTEVFVRIDGRWRIVHTHWSYARAGVE